MLKDVVVVQPLPDHHLRVVFEDGVEGIVNVCELVQFTGVFQPLEKRRTAVQKVCISWKNQVRRPGLNPAWAQHMRGIGRRFVYILRSQTNPARHDVGIAADVDERLQWHTGPGSHGNIDYGRPSSRSNFRPNAKAAGSSAI